MIETVTPTPSITEPPVDSPTEKQETQRSPLGRLTTISNAIWPAYVLYQICLPDDDLTRPVFLLAFALHSLLAVFYYSLRTYYCTIAIPLYMTSFFFLPFLDYPNNNNTLLAIIGTFSVASFVGISKVTFCMSVCLHRYAAHAAFKCSPFTATVLYMVGCLANQDGPVWWASIHRRHHKYCDQPGDPHSPIQHGTEKAMAFFQYYRSIDEEFVPKHFDRKLFRFIEKYYPGLPVTLELLTWYHFGGTVGLFIGYMSSWSCQMTTLWFNVANHPEEIAHKECKAADAPGKVKIKFPGFLMADFLVYWFGPYVGEDNHEHHHDHFALAKHGPRDLGYYCMVLPLEKLGIIWNVKYETTA